MLYFCIYYKDISFIVNQDIAGEKIPYLVCPVGKSSLSCGLLEAESCHIGVNHDLSGRTSICNSWLDNDWLYSSAIKPGKAVERVCCIREDSIMHQNFV